jgi:hypothetical protein
MGKATRKAIYKDGFRHSINGVMRHFTHKLSEHELAVVRGESGTRKLIEMEERRYPQTKYGPCPDGVYERPYIYTGGKAEFLFWFGGKRTIGFKTRRSAELAFAAAAKESKS